MRRLKDYEKEDIESLRYKLLSFRKGAPRQALRISYPKDIDLMLSNPDDFYPHFLVPLKLR